MELRIEYLPVGALKPYERNTRKHGKIDVGKIAESIKKYGFDDPIGIWGEDNLIVEGHGRLMAAQELGMTEVPCIRLDHLSETERREYAIVHNKSAELSSWDFETLELELPELDLSAFDFDWDFEPKGEAKDDDFDTDVEVGKEPFVEPGDIWLLGRHRLMCGDSTNGADVAILMDGKKANLCITDPPYNCAYEGGTGMTIMNDHWDDSQKFYQFLLDAFKNAYDSLADGAAFYCFHSDAEKVNFYNATVNSGFHYLGKERTGDWQNGLPDAA